MSKWFPDIVMFATLLTKVFPFCLLVVVDISMWYFSWCNNFSATNEMEVSNGFTRKLFAIVFRTLSKFPLLGPLDPDAL